METQAIDFLTQLGGRAYGLHPPTGDPWGVIWIVKWFGIRFRSFFSFFNLAVESCEVKVTL